MREWTPTLGAWRERDGTRFRVWAPDHSSVELAIDPEPRRLPASAEGPARINSDVGSGFGRTITNAVAKAVASVDRRPRRTYELRPLERADRGYWTGWFPDLGPGTLYRYRLDGDDAQLFPDPASRYQPEGVHGPSQVIDPAAFRWTDQDWRPPRRESLVFYELHVGAFTAEGTFRGVIERLPYLAQLGVSAIELMPVGDFPGDRNWGYDGVEIFAPARCYGTTDDLRRLVDAAHQNGLAVFLDVVYNHFGPDGAYANAFSRHYFTDRHSSPWGQGVNLDGPYSREVRDFFIENALHWVHEYHVDGLRLDATHALLDDSDMHFLAELADQVRERSDRPVLVVAEDHRNLAHMLLDRRDGGWALDGVWADDFHHHVRVHVAGDREGYYSDYSGSAADIATTMRRGWFFTGQHSQHMGHPRGTDPTAAAPWQFIICIQNHDQIGNRADGARLSHEVDIAVFRAVTTLLLMAPETPLLFMGQEWATGAPFLFFTDHHEELGRQVTAGRREEFSGFAAFADPERRAQIPDPQAETTFARCKLPWHELRLEPHASTLRLYQRLIGLRATSAALRASTRDTYDARALDDETILLIRKAPDTNETIAVVVRLGGSGVAAAPSGSARWQVLLSTEDPDLAADPMPIEIATGEHPEIRFARPGAVILRDHR